ncbi:MAG: DUF2238 domain-containing protein [Planctomycetota bacterium]
MRVTGVAQGRAYALSVMMVLSFSGLYELLEGVVAILVSPELGAEYLGSQGDE